jgi:hypothetical protein
MLAVPVTGLWWDEMMASALWHRCGDLDPDSNKPMIKKKKIQFGQGTEQ